MSRIEKLKALLHDEPNDYFMQHALALEYIKIGNDAESVLVLNKLLTQNPLYVGSYYHLAKLYERAGDETNAIATYEAGMEAAKKLKDDHAYSELKSAYELLIF